MKHLLAQLHTQHPKPLDGLVLVGCGRLRDIPSPLSQYAKQLILIDANPNLEGPNQYALPKGLPCHYHTQVVANQSGSLPYYSTNLPRFDGLLAPSEIPSPPANLRLQATTQRLAVGLAEWLTQLPWPNPSVAEQPGFQWGLLFDIGAAATQVLAALNQLAKPEVCSQLNATGLNALARLCYVGVEHPQAQVQLLPSLISIALDTNTRLQLDITAQSVVKAGFTGQHVHSFLIQTQRINAQPAQAVQQQPATQATATPVNTIHQADEQQALMTLMATMQSGFEEQLALKDQQLEQLAQELQYTQEQLQAQEAVNAELTRHQAQSELAASLLRDELTKAQAQIELIKSLMVGDNAL